MLTADSPETKAEVIETLVDDVTGRIDVELSFTLESLEIDLDLGT